MPPAATDATTRTTVSTEGRGLQAVVAVLVQIVVAVVYSWSVMRGPLTALHGWSKAETIAPYRYNLVLVSLGAILGGFLQDRKGSRLVASIGGLLIALGCVLCALYGDTVGGLILGYGVLAGLGSGFAYVTPIANLVKWFPDKRGTMVGLAVMGSGMSPLFWSPLIENFIGHDATRFHESIPRTFFIMAAIFAVAIIGAAQFYRVPPAGWRPSGWKSSVEVVHREVSSKAMLGTWQFYALWVAFVLGASVGLTAIGQASQLIQEVARTSAPISLGVAVGLLGIFNGSGRLTWGTVSDRLGRKVALLAMSAVSVTACLAFLRSASSFWGVFIGLCLVAFAYGGFFALMPAFTADYYGQSSIGGNYGLVFSAFGFCGFVVPGYFESLLDRARAAGNLVGGYSEVYWKLAILSAIVALMAALLRAPSASMKGGEK
ncbi:MAG: OFA family MFS transporter [Acidobacteriia bacterium]|nr:OFA family MFS transporter [Terriglobia bacterium]